MKIISIPVTALLFILLTGCSLPNPSISPEQNLRSDLELAEDYLANPRMSPVLFQFGTINEEAKEFSGFLVDRYGQIRSYELSETPSEFIQYRSTTLDRALLQRLLDASTDTGVSIDLQELARRVQVYHRQTIQEEDRRQDNPDAKETIAFYAYSVVNSQSGTGTGCGDDNDHSQADEDLVLQLPLYTQGQINLTNQSDYVEEMVQWLTGFISDQLPK